MTPTPGALTEVLRTAEETEAFGARLAALLHPGDLVVLDGPLGAGKTTLVRGLAAALGVRGRVSSPTFIIAREHKPGRPGGVGLIHVDAYRLGDSADPLGELDALDLDAALEDSIVVVEWGAGLAERLTQRYLLVALQREHYSDVRTANWQWMSGGDIPPSLRSPGTDPASGR
ncbi:tRNA (adenosine(37)-N6)-threonylcarbamoyltransferase complex ATPase subunit type 1 TsaE [Smaragdicoccus niigatensis]|uniref:tRNA (adenosine(37)-N6)-threonylcarbamoyltransferase complex ATPase subunit type 1 TsaE n=1 Tax=Smaragdicoccus niigatensis TaxID=359359 RepID=UPI0003761C3B|nr:tRNA (adenosine(37)-N6)-threonylcarbamoyltransferase complex ATPase subunit type 1 TsaE [Smaragdicoccus niigatensis]